MDFREVLLADRPAFNACAGAYSYPICDHCFTDIFMWQGHYRTKICFEDGFCFLKADDTETGKPLFLAPIGEGDLAAAIRKLRSETSRCELPFVMSAVTEGMKARIEAALPGEFEFLHNEDADDYIYLSEKMISLSGKKLASKRNHINRFMADYEGRWEYQDITDDNIGDAFAFHLRWTKEDVHLNDPAFVNETSAISIALQNREELGVNGGLLLLDGEIIGLSLGCPSTKEVYVIQIEKADHTIPGSYQMINQQFALRNCGNYLYINREDDLGLDGLRKAKNSYFPAMKGVKYVAVPKN